MSTSIYPSYPYPIDDVKINHHWKYAFDINGPLWGLDVTSSANVLYIESGAFISNGVVVEVDATFIEFDPSMVEPYYLYGYYGYSDTSNNPVLAISRELPVESAPIAIKYDGTWSLFDYVKLYDIRNTPSRHYNAFNTHIDSSSYYGLVNANSPTLSNIFAKRSDTSSMIPVMKDELKLLPFSLAAGYAINDAVPTDVTSNILYDNVASNSSEFVDVGLRESIDINSITCKYTDCGYCDDPFGNVVISADSSANLYLTRCTAEQQTDIAGLKNRYSHKVKILNGVQPARMVWHYSPYLNISSSSDYIYTNIRVPDTSNLYYIDFIIKDSSGNSAISRKAPYQLDTQSPNFIMLNLANIDQSNIERVEIVFGYKDKCESDYFYVDSFAKASTVNTINLTDTTSQITHIRVSPLIAAGEYVDSPVVDVSLDGGSTYLNNIINNDYNNISSLSPDGTVYKIKLRFNLFNTGGDFYRQAQEWPDYRSGSAVFSDSQSDMAIIIGGECNGSELSSSIIYSKPSDSLKYYGLNINLGISNPGHCRVNKYLQIIGGRRAGIAQKSNYLVNNSNDSVIVRQDLVINTSHSGLVDADDFKTINYMGKDNRGMKYAYEYSIQTDSFLTLTDSISDGQTSGAIIDHLLYSSSGSSSGGTGVKYNRRALVWSSMSLNQFSYYTTCAKLKTRSIIYEGQAGSAINSALFDHDTQTEKSLQTPITGPGESGNAVYHDDQISYGPWSHESTYYKLHNIYISYKTPRLIGYALKYLNN